MQKKGAQKVKQKNEKWKQRRAQKLWKNVNIEKCKY